MKDIHKLRKKVEEKSRALELLKNRFVKLLVENDKGKELTSEVSKLKDLLRSRDAKIITLDATIGLLQTKLDTRCSSKAFKIPFIAETKHTLFCAEHDVVDAPINISDYPQNGEAIDEKMVESNVAFSSRFMPNVKFKVIGNSVAFLSLGFPMMCNYVRTAFNGSIVDMCDYQGRFDDDWKDVKEVSIYEAIPELVPGGMVYDKDSDSLVKKASEVFDDSEALEAILSKAAHRQKFGTEYNPSDAAFKVTEVAPLFSSKLSKIKDDYLDEISDALSQMSQECGSDVNISWFPEARVISESKFGNIQITIKL